MHWKSLKKLQKLGKVDLGKSWNSGKNCQNCPKIWRKIKSRNKCIEKASKNVQKFENVAKSWQNSNWRSDRKKCKNFKNVQKIENLDKTQIEGLKKMQKLQKCPKNFKSWEKLILENC